MTKNTRKKTNRLTKENEQMTQTVQTQVQKVPLREGCSRIRLDYPLNGCLTTVLMILLLVIASNEVKRSKIRLERDQFKLEQLKKDGTFVNDTAPIITPDTFKLGKFEKPYIPLLKMYQERQKD